MRPYAVRFAECRWKKWLVSATKRCNSELIHEALEERAAKYAIRIPANDCLMRDIEELLTRPVGFGSMPKT